MYDDAVFLDTPFLRAALNLYRDWSTFKILPHGKGTLNERQTVIDTIRILTQEENKYTNWEIDKSNRSLEN